MVNTHATARGIALIFLWARSVENLYTHDGNYYLLYVIIGTSLESCGS